MFTLVILYTLYTLVYPFYLCLSLSYCIPCIPLHILCTHVYLSHTVYHVYLYISCVPMFTLVILYTLYTCIPLFILCTNVYPK